MRKRPATGLHIFFLMVRWRLSFLLLGFFAQAALAWDPLNYPSSTHSLIVKKSRAGFNELVSNKCRGRVIEHIQAGKNFRSQTVASLSINVESFPEAETADREFFHYTNPKAREPFETIAREKSFDDIFLFLKTKASCHVNCFWSSYLYIAADSVSSTIYGEVQARIHLVPRAKIFLAYGDRPGFRPLTPKGVVSMIEKELVVNHPRLAPCANAKGRLHTDSILSVLAIEAEQISAIAYWGIGNISPDALRMNAGERPPYQWLQLVGPWAIDSMIIGARD